MKNKAVIALVMAASYSSSVQAQSVISYVAVAAATERQSSNENTSSGTPQSGFKNDFSKSEKVDETGNSRDDNGGNGFQLGERGKWPDFYVPSRGNPFDSDKNEDDKKNRGNHGHSPHWDNVLPPGCTPIPEPSTYAGLLGLTAFGIAVRRRLYARFRLATVTRADTGS